jgi:hypothetical protein
MFVVPAYVPPSAIAPLVEVGPNASESEYRGVYKYPKGGWVARVRIPSLTPGRAPLRNISGVVQYPTHAAYILARWYEDRYGADWPRVVRLRGEKGKWATPWRAWFSQSRNGWLMCVWERGTRVEVTRLTATGNLTSDLKVFRSRDDAIRYLPAWAKRRYGDDAGRILYRL